ncbi:aminotransferase [Paralimibaculum aggregatum]|uniref:aspartate transaminase n=1 Tax=Paralimibaculum aggregatum TaxID=3036245 RepID=A0ABQ6LQX4_9RHOB|nr:aminotransferase [Limibaculum sp. NKW23]GMG83678.1 aminotransferase [Limibaculum sp. NKW23]
MTATIRPAEGRPAPVNPQLARVFAPPVMEARRWLTETRLPEGLELLNLSQAAPVDPPPERLRAAMAGAVGAPGEAHLYGAVLGDGPLRAQIAADWSEHYGAPIAPEQVAITAGCNQAFCAAIATLCAPGDAVLLPVPWYFNHKMWLGMQGIEAVPLPCGPDMVPDLAAARALLTPQTRALVLVTPNNPTGVEYPPGLMEAAYDLAREAGIGLIVDETYRDFHSAAGAPHGLFARPDWDGTLIHLYSFSKVFRLTGHRTGAIVTGAARLAEAEKFLDTVTICPPRTGQIAALEGLRHLRQWVAGERAEILARRDALRAAFAGLEGWQVLGSGAYFAWVRPPFDMASDRLALRLLEDQAILTLPGTMFVPEAAAAAGNRALRIAFANADAAGLAEMGRRLAAFAP